MTLIETAQKLAHDAHDSIEQKRKYTGEPYWKHTDAVAELVQSVGGSEEMVAAAHLHDFLEDVVPQLEAERRFNQLKAFEKRYYSLPITVRNMVNELTDEYTKKRHPDLNRKERKAKERERLAKISVEAKTIKLADLINNTSDIVTNDPNFARTYLSEKLDLLPYLAEGHPALLNRAAWQIAAGCAKLGLDLPLLVAPSNVGDSSGDAPGKHFGPD